MAMASYASQSCNIPVIPCHDDRRPFGIKISRLSCFARELRGLPPPSPPTPESSIALGDRTIYVYQLHDAGINIVKGKKGAICEGLSRHGKFYEFKTETPIDKYKDRYHWIFKQEEAFTNEQLAQLNERVNEHYGSSNAYQKDSYGYIHTTLRNLCQNVIAEAFSSQQYFVPSHLALDESGLFGLLLPYFEDAINVDEWLNMHNLIINAAENDSQRSIIEKQKTEKNRYLNTIYCQAANSAFERLKPHALEKIRFIDNICNQTDRAKLSNLILIGDHNETNIDNLQLLAIDQDLAFAQLKFEKREDSGYHPVPDHDKGHIKAAQLGLSLPCCQQWCNRLIDVLTPILPTNSEVVETSIRRLRIENQLIPLESYQCYSKPIKKHHLLSSDSEDFSGSGSRRTSVDLSHGSSSDSLELAIAKGASIPATKEQIAPPMTVHVPKLHHIGSQLTAAASPSIETEFEDPENLPSLGSLSLASGETAISSATLQDRDNDFSDTESSPEQSH